MATVTRHGARVLLAVPARRRPGPGPGRCCGCEAGRPPVIRSTWRRRSVAVLSAALAITVAVAESSAAAPSSEDRIERPVRSSAPDSNLVKETYVRIRDPLPASVGPHPARCDWLGHLRFRSAEGPRRSRRADAIVVAMPGFTGGASGFDQLARNVIREGASRGRDVEFWALDRRANCLEDHRGTKAAARRGNVRIAFDYYYGDRKIRGRRFGGFKQPREVRFLGEFGLERTVRDWYTVLRSELPSRRQRARKLVCGGHSLGGPITGAFAGWDFDGDPATRHDAGYKQCAAFFGLDTFFEANGSSAVPTGFSALVELLAESGVAPYVDAPPITPQTLQVLGPIGVAAYQRPGRESPIPDLLPRTAEFDLTTRLLFSRNAAEFLTGEPSIRDFRIGNEAVLGAIFDDNSSPISIVRASLGVYRGGPVVDKDFPAPNAAHPLLRPLNPALPVDSKSLMAPRTPHGPLYRWRDYDRVAGPPVLRDDTGAPYTTDRSEVTDIEQLARALFEAPANLWEEYFPTRIVLEGEAAAVGDRSGDLRAYRYDGIARRPALLVQAGDGVGSPDAEAGGAQGPGGTVTLPGYDHVDVVTATCRQNGGRSERSSRKLARFALAATGALGSRARDRRCPRR